jgi:hypothetical protein
MSKCSELPLKRQEEIAMPETKATPSNFTQISNEVLLDERLSFKARGILALLLSRPKDWKIYIDEIVERSDADGKHSVRTGFKELKIFGYLNLVKVWNEATGKFEGTVYQLCQGNIPKSQKPKEKATQKNLARPTNFQPDDKTDLPKIARTENRSVEKSVLPKTVTPSNTKYSNTKHSNTKIQQQQTKVDDDTFLNNEILTVPVAAALAAVCENKEVVCENNTAAEVAVTRKMEKQIATDLLPFLQNDEVWKKQFVGKNICKELSANQILTVAMLDLLLKHFTQTSISSGATYPNRAAIKRHFFNWFNVNLNKNALPNYIEQQTVAPKKVRNQVAVLMPKTDAIINKIYAQQCDNETHLYRCLQILETHLAVYENALNVLDEVNQKAVSTWILDIQKTKTLVERGRKVGQLSWFCKRTITFQSGVKKEPQKKVNHTITRLSQRFAVT